jgi:hypothetical protein
MVLHSATPWMPCTGMGRPEASGPDTLKPILSRPARQVGSRRESRREAGGIRRVNETRLSSPGMGSNRSRYWRVSDGYFVRRELDEQVVRLHCLHAIGEDDGIGLLGGGRRTCERCAPARRRRPQAERRLTLVCKSKIAHQLAGWRGAASTAGNGWSIRA